MRQAAERGDQARRDGEELVALAADPCPGLKWLPAEHELRIDPEAEKDLWRLRHAMEALATSY